MNLQVNSYIHQKAFSLGEDGQDSADPCEDIAIVDPNDGYRIVCSRGKHLKYPDSVIFKERELQYLEKSLAKHKTVAVLALQGPMLVLGDLLRDTDLLLVILPNGSPATVAETLTHLPLSDFAVSPTLRRIGRKNEEMYRLYDVIMASVESAHRFLRPEKDFDFRLHCALIAEYMGCRANVLTFPMGHIPLSHADVMRWTAFCCCLLLTLRRDSIGGPSFRLTDATLRDFSLEIEHASERRRLYPVSIDFQRFLDFPCFRDFRLTVKQKSFRIEVKLLRQTADTVLHADGGYQLLTLEFALEETIEKDGLA